MKEFYATNLSFSKRIILIALLFLGWHLDAQIFSNPITGTNPSSSNPYTTGQTVASNLTVSGIGMGSGLTGSSVTDAYAATGWNNGGSGAHPDTYFEFSLTPSTCYDIDFTQLALSISSNESNPSGITYFMRVSTNNFTTFSATPSTSFGSAIIFDLSSYQNISTNIKFRIYFYKVTNGSYVSINNFSFTGAVTPSTPTPIIGTITQPACPTVTGSVALSGLPSGMYTINQLGSTTATYTGLSGATQTITGLAAGNYTFTVTNAASCTSAATANVPISSITTTWNGSSWSNSVPDITKQAIMAGNYDMVTNTALPNITACSMIVNALATVTVKDGAYVKLQNSLQVIPTGSFIIKNNGTLVQINNVANSGNISMERTAKSIDWQDYVFWSSPVAGFDSRNISSTTSNKIYKWAPTTSNLNNWGVWISGRENMIPGLGYIERGLNTAATSAPVDFTTTFTGVPNNGDVSIGIERGNYDSTDYTAVVTSTSTQATKDDDNWNALGNPYPSAISAAEFLTANNTNLDGFVEIWKHTTDASTGASDPYYQDYGYNYSSSNYFKWNLLGSNDANTGFDGFIAAGQGFITKMLHTSPTPANAVFTNAMRVDGSNLPYNNTQFHRTAKGNKTSVEQEKGRVWLSLTDPKTASIMNNLVGYIDGATNAKDQMYDAQADLKLNFNIYSIVENERVSIQGRSLPFSAEDQVPVVAVVPAKGDYKIGIAKVDGFLKTNDQKIYLEDKAMNIIHDLTQSPYTFTTETTGEQLKRFVLRYTNTTLGGDTFDYANSVKVFGYERITVESSNQSIKNIEVYDVLGKVIYRKKDVNATNFNLTELTKTQNVLIVKVTLENEIEVVKKVIF